MTLRSLFLFLLLANLLLFALGRGLLGRSEAGREPGRLDAQVMPERLSIVARGKAAADAQAARPAPEAAPAPLPSPAAAIGPAVAEACREAGGLSPDQALILAEWVRPDSARVRVTQTVVDEPTSWWVYVPPAADKAASEARVAALRRLGVTDFYVVQDAGPNFRAISLGVFKSADKAEEALAALTRKGVKTARAGPRDVTTRVNQRFVGDAEVLQRLAENVRTNLVSVTLADCVATR